MRLGVVARRADFHSVGLFDNMRKNKDALEDKDISRLAFVLGWLSHRAADRQMKPIFRETCPDAPVRPTDCSIYQDAFIFLRRYQDQAPPYRKELFQRMSDKDPLAQRSAGLKSIIRALLQGTLIGLHTLIPDDDQPKTWLDKVTNNHQRWVIDMDRYLDAIYNPDAEKQHDYIVATDFYHPDDSLIHYVEQLQGKENISSHAPLNFAGEQKSHYAQALDKSWGFIKCAGQYWKGAIDNNDLAAGLDHGQKLRDGMGG